jgi:altronate dehydratase large subunit
MRGTFQGYRRSDGRIGIRNHLLILSATGLTGPTARRIGRLLPRAVVLALPHGSGHLGEDAAAQDRAVRGLACHPNVGAVLVIGADPPLVEAVAGAAETAGKLVEALTFDGCGHDALTLLERGVRAGARLQHAISRRQPAPEGMAGLFLGLECGRSDPSSGLVANPLLGRIADSIVAAGGRAVIGETTEWLGAEHRLAARATTPELSRAITRAAARREAMAVAAGIDLTGSNPSATNIAAGLSSIEEKSLGAIAKSGRSPIESLLDYAEAPAGPGLHVMDAPAYAPESVTGFVAAGANLVLFTTGVGNSYTSALAPTLKLSANPVTCERLKEQLDFDASAVFTGAEPIEAAAERLFELVRVTASGALTWGEILDDRDEVVSRFGPSL